MVVSALSHVSHKLLCQPKDRFGQDMTAEKSGAFKSIHPSLTKFWLKFTWKIYKIFTLLMLQL